MINTGILKLIMCKTPRYSPHKTRVINKVTSKLETQGIIEDCEGLSNYVGGQTGSQTLEQIHLEALCEFQENERSS